MRGQRGGGTAQRGRAVVALLVLAAVCPAVALAGCGVPGSTTERVAPSEVPSGLLDPAPSGGPAGSGGPGGPWEASGSGVGVTAALLAARAPSTYLLDARDVLVAVPLQRPQATTGPATTSPGPAAVGDEEATALTTVLLRRLAGGPAPAQRDQGLSTALGPGVPVVLVDVVDGTARVTLRQPDRDPPADRLPLAIGQVVLTVTSAPGVARVQLLRDGEPTAVPLPDGARSDAPVTAADYAVLLAAAR